MQTAKLISREPDLDGQDVIVFDLDYRKTSASTLSLVRFADTNVTFLWPRKSLLLNKTDTITSTLSRFICISLFFFLTLNSPVL